ncbi:MAG: hypothetical protein RMK67_03435 [Chloroflexota bacterium]|nr:hypothetical protein [Chloroflexota bacterium]
MTGPALVVEPDAHWQAAGAGDAGWDSGPGLGRGHLERGAIFFSGHGGNLTLAHRRCYGSVSGPSIPYP